MIKVINVIDVINLAAFLSSLGLVIAIVLLKGGNNGILQKILQVIPQVRLQAQKVVNMVFVKVRETYDLQTVKNKMTVIGIHTPNPSIIKRNYPGLLMQCKAYRPVSCDVRIACASLEPLDALQVGVEPGTIAPEDVFNPILYKAMSNFGMSQLEARINALRGSAAVDVAGNCADVDADSVTPISDEFNVYYGLLSNTHEWKHAAPQSGLAMQDLRPLVWEALYNVGDNGVGVNFAAPNDAGNAGGFSVQSIRGNSKPIPFINTTYYTYDASKAGDAAPGFTGADIPYNAETGVPWINCYVAAIVAPPSKLHSLFYRMIVEWTLEFSQIRPISEISNWYGLERVGDAQHYTNYSYESTKKIAVGDVPDTMDHDSCMVSSNVEVNKVM